MREYAEQIGLSPSFTIADREDAADLMSLMRQELNLSSRDKRFPLKGTCLSIYSRVVNTCEPLAAVLQSMIYLQIAWGYAQWKSNRSGRSTD